MTAAETVELVVRTPPKARVGYVVVPAMGIGAIAWMALTRSTPSFAVGGFMLLLSAFNMWGIVSNLRHLGGEPMRIEATRDGIGCQFWRIAWGEVERLEVRTVAGARALMVVPRTRRGVERRGTTASKVSGHLGALMRSDGSVRVLEAWIDRSLETLAGELERLAGRPLLASAEA